MGKAKTAKKRSVDFQEIKQAASGRWTEILSSLCSIAPEYLDGRHGPCPLCGGHDRWRVYDNFSETGGAICNQCGPNLGDGIKVVAWQRNVSQFEAAVAVAKHLGIEIKGDRRRQALAEEQLEWQPWSDLLVDTLFCSHKPPITVEAIRACGGAASSHLLQAIRDLGFPRARPAAAQSGPRGVGLVRHNGRISPCIS
ncbi:MAG: primase-helicase zinc-binding domain-containing protein [bacterium]